MSNIQMGVVHPVNDGLKEFSAHIEFPVGHSFHKVAVWFRADNIVEAGQYLMEYFGPLGINTAYVKRLVEVEAK